MGSSGCDTERYRKFVKERLEVDYESVVKDINVIFAEIREYETLRLAISKIKETGVKENLETQVNIGKNIFCDAEISDCQRIIVKLGGDIFAELTLDRAEQYVEKRINLLNERASILEKEGHSIKARIHLILSSLNQLELYKEDTDTSHQSKMD
uniref:Prefoldin subunit alpha n=1 Tax=Syphacia muris TaxID=451379 RepID=A0A0N5AQU2_9BILA